MLMWIAVSMWGQEAYRKSLHLPLTFAVNLTAWDGLCVQPCLFKKGGLRKCSVPHIAEVT